MFILGPNASGKSNFLDTVRFMRDVAKQGGGLQSAIRDRGGLSKIRSLAARSQPDIQLAFELGEPNADPEWRYELGITQQSRGYRQPILRYERVFRTGQLILDRPNGDDKYDELRLTQTHLEQINSNSEFREIARFFETVRYLHLVPQLMRSPEAFTKGPTQPDEPFGRNFLEMVVKTPEKTRQYKLSKIEAALKEAVPQLRNLQVVKDETGVPHLEATYEHWRPNAGKQREDQFSDGTIRMIGLFWSLLEGESPLLLEEPELSLHSSIVERLAPLFSKLQAKRRRQILVSTHSEELVGDKGIGAEEVVLLEPSKEGTTAVRLSDIPESTNFLKAGFSVADFVMPRSAPSRLGQLALFE